MNIALYSPAEDARFGFALREERGMGGSEAHAQMRMQEWARRGHTCAIFDGTLRSAPQDVRNENGVAFWPPSCFNEWNANCWDLFILQRRAPADHSLLEKIRAFRVFSNNDNLPREHPACVGWREHVYPNVDAVMAYSWFHWSRVVFEHGAPPEKTHVIPHPLDPREFPEPWAAKVPGRFIYCSLPNRGLGRVIECWPHIKALLPEATILVAGDYTIRDGPAHADTLRANNAEFFGREEVAYEGALGSARLREEQAKAEVLLFPTEAEETFCAAVAECQAAGCVPVLTPVGALPETAVPEVTARFGKWQTAEQFARKAVALIEDREALRRMAEAGRARALREFDVAKVCDRWEAMVG